MLFLNRSVSLANLLGVVEMVNISFFQSDVVLIWKYRERKNEVKETVNVRQVPILTITVCLQFLFCPKLYKSTT